jgi:hypothetical protein
MARRKAVDETADITSVEAESKPIIPKDIDPNTMVLVKNGFHGPLIYISSRTKERVMWNEFGDEQEMELKELRNAKSSAKKFFENNWFMFSDEYKWVVSYLGLNKYYKYAVKLEDFDEIFEKKPEEVADIISKMTKGQKHSLSYRARQLVMNGEIDSRKMIAALEEALDTEFIEK